MVYITKGRGTFASDTTPSVDISKGQILFLFPGQWHTYAPLQKTGWNEYYIGFEGPIIDNLVKNSFISKENQILDIGINEELASLFARALEVAEADKTAAQQYLSGKMCIRDSYSTIHCFQRSIPMRIKSSTFTHTRSFITDCKKMCIRDRL